MTSPLLNRRELLAALGASAVGAVHAAPADLPISTRELWTWVRAQQLIEPAVAYFDTASLGPGLRAALAVEYRHQEQFNSDIDAYQKTHLSSSALGATLQRLANLIGCKPDELAITQGATEALGIIANGLQLAAGDEVVVTSHAHPSAIYPWLLRAQRQGILVKQVALPSPLQDGEQALGAIAAAVGEKTRVIAFSHLQYTDGAVLPVADICAFARQRNILTVVDGAQAPGSLNVNVAKFGCDFYAASCHKWLNGPHGVGLLYVRGELLPSLSPTNVDSNLGWNVINRYGQASIDDEAQRVTWPATLAKFGCNVRFFGPKLKALEATLDFRDQLSADRIEARIRELAIYARLRLQSLSDFEILTPAQPGMWAGILSFRPRTGSTQEMAQRLKRNYKMSLGFVAHPAVVGDHPAPEFAAVRASFHIYNSHDEIERLVRALG